MFGIDALNTSYTKKMKFLYLFLMIGLPLHAKYQKPQLLARYSDTHAWNASDNTFCFGSEPLVTEREVYLGCQDDNGFFMARFSPAFQKLIAASPERLFSLPLFSQGKISWNEFDEGGVRRLFEMEKGTLKTTELKNLGPATATADSFVPNSFGSFIYRLQDEGLQLWEWKEGQASPLFTQKVAHIFPPVIDEAGGFLIKTRENATDESGADRLWYAHPDFKLVFEDQDANPHSPWLTFRHQMALSQGRIALYATDKSGEALILLDKGVVKEIARTGREIKSFDYFSPKLRGETLVFRGVDSENRKAIWVYSSAGLARLLTQGDVVKTDIGLARVHYANPDALFYGAPGIGPHGEIVQQATLTDIDYPATLLGIGLLKFVPENPGMKHAPFLRKVAPR
jgi:hypothetical protein